MLLFRKRFTSLNDQIHQQQQHHINLRLRKPNGKAGNISEVFGKTYNVLNLLYKLDKLRKKKKNVCTIYCTYVYVAVAVGVIGALINYSLTKLP